MIRQRYPGIKDLTCLIQVLSNFIVIIIIIIKVFGVFFFAFVRIQYLIDYLVIFDRIIIQ